MSKNTIREIWWLPSDNRCEKTLQQIDKLWEQFNALEDWHMDNGYPKDSAKKLRKLQNQITKLLTPEEKEDAYGEMENFGLY